MSARRKALGRIVSKMTSFKFNKEQDTGPMDYQSMDPQMANTIHEERIRRQVASRRYPPPSYSKTQ